MTPLASGNALSSGGHSARGATAEVMPAEQTRVNKEKKGKKKISKEKKGKKKIDKDAISLPTNFV